MTEPSDRVNPTVEGDAPTGTPSAAADPPVLPSPRSASPPKGASKWMLAAVAALAIVAALAAWLDGRRAESALRSEVAQRLAAVESATQAAASAQTGLSTALRDAQARTTLLETRIAESQAQQAALEALYRDLAPSRDEIALSEIEQVLLLASQQLQLAGNVPSALAALQLADAKLQRLDRPQSLALRRALGRDIDALKATPYVDVAGLSLKLDQAITSVGGLTLARDERIAPPPPEPNADADLPLWRRLLRDTWADLRQLIRIEVADRPLAPLVPPAQSYFLRENLRLRLLSARIALLNRDEASFRADLAAADSWVRQYFDLRTKPVQTLQATLKQAAAAPTPGSVPDLARSLEALRTLKLAQERAAGRAAAK
jgi:uroporphyrin-III C-methyltransferase